MSISFLTMIKKKFINSLKRFLRRCKNIKMKILEIYINNGIFFIGCG